MTDAPFITHHSHLATLRKCEARWSYQYVEGLEPIYSSANMVLGTWFHAVRAADTIAAYGPSGENTLLMLPEELDLPHKPMQVQPPDEDAVVRGIFPVNNMFSVEGALDGDLVIEAAAAWWTHHAGEAFHEDFHKRYSGVDLSDHLKGLRDRYRDRWDEQDRGTLTPLLVEFKWRAMIPGTDVMLQGTVDEVLLDTRFNLVVIRDYKTHGQWPSESDIVLDLMGSQLHLYAWGVAQMLSEMDLGVPTSGRLVLEYDRIRTKVPATPQLTQMGSLSKSVTDYDLWTYMRWATVPPDHDLPDDHYLRYPGRKKDGSQSGVYEVEDGVVESLRADADAFFRRRRFPANESVVRTHVKNAVRDAQVMKETTPENARRSTGGHCSWCPMLMLCRAQMFGEIDTTDYDPEDYGLKIKDNYR